MRLEFSSGVARLGQVVMLMQFKPCENKLCQIRP
jgi:hypothetical protein